MPVCRSIECMKQDDFPLGECRKQDILPNTCVDKSASFKETTFVFFFFEKKKLLLFGYLNLCKLFVCLSNFADFYRVNSRLLL